MTACWDALTWHGWFAGPVIGFLIGTGITHWILVIRDCWRSRA